MVLDLLGRVDLKQGLAVTVEIRWQVVPTLRLSQQGAHQSCCVAPLPHFHLAVGVVFSALNADLVRAQLSLHVALIANGAHIDVAHFNLVTNRYHHGWVCRKGHFSLSWQGLRGGKLRLAKLRASLPKFALKDEQLRVRCQCPILVIRKRLHSTPLNHRV